MRRVAGGVAVALILFASAFLTACQATGQPSSSNAVVPTAPANQGGAQSTNALDRAQPGGAPSVPKIPGCAQAEPRRIPAKPAHTEITAGPSADRIVVRFVDGTGVRLRAGKLVSTSGADLVPLYAVLSSYKVDAQRLYSAPEEQIDAELMQLEQQTCTQFADKNLAYLFILAPGQNAGEFVDRLNALPIVEIAYPENIPVNP